MIIYDTYRHLRKHNGKQIPKSLLIKVFSFAEASEGRMAHQGLGSPKVQPPRVMTIPRSGFLALALPMVLQMLGLVANDEQGLELTENLCR